MDYKQKYNEALERAQKLQENSNGMILKKWLWRVFPELQENEDERIRKEIIDFLRLPHHQFAGKRDHEKWIAWLEKQGKLKEGDKKEDIVARYPCAGEPIPCGVKCENNLSHEGVMDRFEILSTIKDQMMNGNGDIFTFTKWLQEFIDKEIGNTPLTMSY